jgi:hypothetical protein
MVVPYWKMGWLPSVVFGIPFDDPEESTTAVTTPAAITALTPTPVQNHHVLYTGGDSSAGAAACRSAPAGTSAPGPVPEAAGKGEGGVPKVGKSLVPGPAGSAAAGAAVAGRALPWVSTGGAAGGTAGVLLGAWAAGGTAAGGAVGKVPGGGAVCALFISDSSFSSSGIRFST